jgi:hypothetical protein
MFGANAGEIGAAGFIHFKRQGLIRFRFVDLV